MIDKEKQVKRQNEFIRQKYDRVHLALPAGEKKRIEKAAKEQGESLTEYFYKSALMRMEGEQ